MVPSSGHVWRGEYLVAALVECRDLDLRYDAIRQDAKLPVYRVREIVVLAEKFVSLEGTL